MSFLHISNSTFKDNLTEKEWKEMENLYKTVSKGTKILVAEFDRKGKRKMCSSDEFVNSKYWQYILEKTDTSFIRHFVCFKKGEQTPFPYDIDSLDK
jgi:hypothetical protein